MSSKYKIRINKKNSDKALGFSAGAAVGPLLGTTLHEAGHGVAIKLAGEEPSFHMGNLSDMSNLAYVSYYSEKVPKVMQTIISAAGPLTNFFLAGTSAYLANKTDNKKLKYGLKGFSIINTLLPACYVVGDFLGISSGDFNSMAANGVGYEYTLPLTIGASAALTYYNFKDYFKDRHKDKTSKPEKQPSYSKSKHEQAVKMIDNYVSTGLSDFKF